MLRKRYAEACAKLEASQRLDPAGGTLLNLALCHEAEGKLATAWVEFGDALSQARQDRKNDRIKIAREHMEKLESRLPRLTIRPGKTRPPGLKIERDGVAMTDASFGTPIPVDPGAHTLRAQAPRHRPAELRVTLAEGESKTVELPPLEPEPEPSASSSSSPTPTPSSGPLLPSSRRKTAGYIAGGVGVAALAVGAFYGLRTFSRKSESDRECPSPTTCSARGVQANEEAYSAATAANIGLGVGLLGVGVGAYLLLSASPAPPAGAYRVTPALGSNGGGLLVDGRFLPLPQGPPPWPPCPATPQEGEKGKDLVRYSTLIVSWGWPPAPPLSGSSG